MEELRKQFEKWCQCERNGVILKIGIDGEYNSRESQIMWEAWQASRAAIEIELPKNKWHPCDCIDVVVAYDKDDIDQCIRAAGLRVKEK